MSTIIVTNLYDSGAGSLRQAILYANSGDVIDFASNLVGGTLVLTSGELDIDKNITINGDLDGSPDITISGAYASRVFNVVDGTSGSPITATLSGLMIVNGYAAGGNGGGIAVGKYDAVTLSTSRLADNTANYTAGLGGGDGGAISVDTGGTLTLISSTIDDNNAQDNGGGISAASGSGQVNVIDSTVSHNTAAANGGGIYDSSGSLNIVNSTLSGNSTGSGNGGGVSASGSTLKLVNATLAGNAAADTGGAISADFSTVSIYDSTLTGNYGKFVGAIETDFGSLTLSNSIVAGNYGRDVANDVYGFGPNANIVFKGNNIVGSAPDATAFATIQGSYTQINGTQQTDLETVFGAVGPNPDTGVLSGLTAKNGGPVRTVAINPSGIAYDAGSNTDLPQDTFDLNNNGNTTEPLPVDARGFTRVAGGTVDIGAFEQQPNAAFLVTTLDDEPYDGGNLAQETADGNGLSLREALALANASPGHSIAFAPDLTGGTILLTNGELDITGDGITINGDIDGNGTPDIAIDAVGNYSRLFDVNVGANVIGTTFNGLVMEGGYAGAYNGGAIAVEGSSDSVTVSNSRLDHNRAGYAGAPGGGEGGAIFLAPFDKLTLVNSTIDRNYAAAGGGGIYGYASTIYIVNSTLSANSTGTSGIGGGIYNNNGTLNLYNATLSGNSAYAGGGIENTKGTVNAYDSTLTGNRAHSTGGIESTYGPLTLTNSLVAGNHGQQRDDITGPTYFKGNNIVGSSPGGGHIDTSQGSFTQVDGTTQAGLSTVFLRVGYDPHTGVLSGVLADNGGPVRTVAIAPGGVAYNAGSNAALPPDSFDLNNNGNTAEPLPLDARGFQRNVGGAVDIGAFEQQQGHVFIVTTLADETYDGGTLAQETVDGTGLSLREALGLANKDPNSNDVILFDPSLIGGSTHGVNDGTLLLTNGQLTINGNVTIEGDVDGDGTPDITIDGQDASRDLSVLGGNVSLDGLTITGGYADVHGGGVSLGTGAYGPANVTLSHSVITNNKAAYGGGISINYGDSLALTNSVVSGNSAYYIGGGIANQGVLQMRDVTVSGNTAGYTGGGIASDYALIAVNTTISDNQVTYGGSHGIFYSAGSGLYNSGFAALANTTISGNKGAYAGGGIYNSSDLQLTNVTLADNSAANGGGLYNAYCGCGDAKLYDSTVTGNNAQQFGGGIDNANGTVTLTNTIVAGNRAGYQGSDVLTAPLATTNYTGVNLFSQTNIGQAGTDITQPDLTQVFGDLTTIDPDGMPGSGDEFQAGTLANNGGPVETVALAVGGSAQNTGSTADLPPDIFDPAVPLSVDARGSPRVSGPAVDIGAFETQPPVLTQVPASAGYTEQAPPVELSPPFGSGNETTVTDPGVSPTQAVIAGATAIVTSGGVAGDTLAADTTGTAITASYDSASETLTLSGADTLADYSLVLDSVTFSSPSDNPDNFGANPTRTVTWSVVDVSGATSAPGTTTAIAITAVNDAPVLSNVAAAAAAALPGQAITLSPALAVSDPDDLTLAGAVVQITGGTFAGDGDVLAATTAGTNISASYDSSSETLTLNGIDTLADYAQVLGSVTFESTSANPTNGEADKTRTVTWTADDGHGSNNLSAPALTTISFQQSIPFDLNGDTVSDLVFQNNGTPQIWLWNGTAVTSQVTFANPGASWHIITSRDVNGDGNADLIWQNSDGTPGIWLMNGTTPTAQVGLTNPGSNWHVVAAGDLDGDGKADLIWQDAGGTPGIWLMNGTTPTAEAGLTNPGANWKVVGAADFNADGRDDILLQDTTTGNLMVDLMNGTSVTSTVSITVGDPSWHAVSTGEFNGQAEIAWQNSNGTPGLWLMNGTTPVAEAAFANPGTAWKVVSIDHFTPDGQADLLFQHTSGAIGLWEMNGTSIVAEVSLPNPGAGWQSVNGHPFAT